MAVSALGLPWARPAFGGAVSGRSPVRAVSTQTVERTDSFVRFGQTAKPTFIAPMVVANAPRFEPDNPESVAFYTDLMRKAQTFSKAAVSKYQVGAVLVGESGRAYLGTNIEVKGDSTADTVHGEGFVVTMARAYQETGLTDLLLSGPPCGHCRQMLFEIGNPNLRIHIVDRQTGAVTSRRFQELLPIPFDSTGANAEKNLLRPSHPPMAVKPKSRNALVQEAIEGAFRSYLPKPGRKGWGGIALRLKDGEIVNGGLLTVSGANPTLFPLQEALVKVVANGKQFADIAEAVLVEPKDPDYSYYRQTRAILGQIAPAARLRRVSLEE